MTEETVYKYLIKTFGGISYSGVKYLAYLICNMAEKDKIKDHYIKIAERVGSTPSAVERAVRYYLRYILTQVSIEDLSVMYDYPFAVGTERLNNTEFVRLLQFALEGNL